MSIEPRSTDCYISNWTTMMSFITDTLLVLFFFMMSMRKSSSTKIDLRTRNSEYADSIERFTEYDS
jgi:hypothetical protein